VTPTLNRSGEGAGNVEGLMARKREGMMLKETVKKTARIAAPPFVRSRPIATWPGWLGRTLGVKVPQSLAKKKRQDRLERRTSISSAG